MTDFREGVPFCPPPPIRQQPRKNPSWIGLTVLSANAKSAVLCILLSVPSLTKVEVSNFPLPYFPRWFLLIHGQLGMSLRRVKRLVIFKCLSLRYSTMVSFILSTTFSLTEIHPQRDSVESQLLRLYSQFDSPKY